MPVEYVPVLDENGDDVGGYTETVPESYVREEPDCFTCCDRGCPECDGSQADTSKTVSLDEAIGNSRWGGYSNEPPF